MDVFQQCRGFFLFRKTNNSWFCFFFVQNTVYPYNVCICFQECLFFNEWLCFIRQSLHQIEASLLRGIESLPPHLQTAAHSLAKEEVPLSWLSNCHTPSTHTLYSFLKSEWPFMDLTWDIWPIRVIYFLHPVISCEWCDKDWFH